MMFDDFNSLFLIFRENHWDYLELRLWIGAWTGLILIIMVALDLSAWVRYITRFTEESFALLISLIFIKEAFAKLFKVASTHPIHFFPEVFYPHHICHTMVKCFPPRQNANDTLAGNSSMVDNSTLLISTNMSATTPSVSNVSNITAPSILWSNLNQSDCIMYGGYLDVPECDATTNPEVFFLSVILFAGTFTLAMSLKMMRNTRFFPNFVSIFKNLNNIVLLKTCFKGAANKDVKPNGNHFVLSVHPLTLHCDVITQKVLDLETSYFLHRWRLKKGS